MAHAGPNELRLQLLVVAVLHVPQHERRKTVLFLQALQRGLVHAAGGDQHQSSDLSGIALHIDLRHHAAVAGADENRVLDAERAEEGVHPGNQRLIGAQLLRIVKQPFRLLSSRMGAVPDGAAPIFPMYYKHRHLSVCKEK